MIKVKEAIKLLPYANSTDAQKAIEIFSAVVSGFAIDDPNLPNSVDVALVCVFNAGRIQGIREMRCKA